MSDNLPVPIGFDEPAPELKLYDFPPGGTYDQLWSVRESPLVLSGPAGTGKTRFILEKVHALCLEYPGIRVLFIRKTRESLAQSALVTFEDRVVPNAAQFFGDQSREHRLSYKYPPRMNHHTGKVEVSEIVLGGMQQSGKDNIARIMSTEYDIICAFELIEFDQDDLEKMCSRLRNFKLPFQQFMGDTNPGPPTHWIKRMEKEKELKLVETTHKDNPAYWDNEKKEWTPHGLQYVGKTLANLHGIQKERLFYGRWVQAEGVVYDTFDINVHVIKAMPAGWQSWRKVRAVDFGYANPFVCLWAAIDYDGRIYVYREWYMSRMTVRRHAVRMTDESGFEEFETTVADHDAEDRATLRESDIETTSARKDITTGIQRVVDRLAVQEDGRPRLFFLEDSLIERDEVLWEKKETTSIIEEFGRYVWPKGLDGKLVKEKPVDKDNHGLDALRYLVMYVDKHLGAIEKPQETVARVEREEAQKVQAQEEWLSPENPLLWTELDDSDEFMDAIQSRFR